MLKEWKQNCTKRGMQNMKLDWERIALVFLMAAMVLLVFAVAAFAAGMESLWISTLATICAVISCVISITKRG
jgi:lipopolysaccharide export LptBFGC system permease protein LptF